MNTSNICIVNLIQDNCTTATSNGVEFNMSPIGETQGFCRRNTPCEYISLIP